MLQQSAMPDRCTHTHGACEVRTRPQSHSSHQAGACNSSIQHKCGVQASAQHAHTCSPSGDVDEQIDMLVGSCIARWSYVSGLSMPVVLLQLRSRLAVCLLYELAIGMHVCMGRFAQLHIARGRVCAHFNSDELNRQICYFVFRLQCTRAGTPEREKLY
jgi:hypothetical protein